jgi:hypothetical protein
MNDCATLSLVAFKKGKGYTGGTACILVYCNQREPDQLTMQFSRNLCMAGQHSFTDQD